MGTPPPATWHLYVVRTADGSLYTGIATDVDRRIGEHRDGRGAKYLRGRGPLRVVYRCAVGRHGQALQAEHRVKRLTRADKERLVATGAEPPAGGGRDR